MESLRERKKNRRRVAILDAAEALFRERGFEATRVKDIVERVEISEPTFFKYFASKQAVVDALGLRWIGASTAAWPSVPTDGPADALLESLSSSFQGFVEELERDRDYARLLLTHSSVWSPQGSARGMHAKPGHPLHEETMAGFLAMAKFFGTLQDRGVLRAELDPMQLAEMSFAVFRTTLQLWATGYWQVDYDLHSRLRAAFDVLFRGMGASPR